MKPPVFTYGFSMYAYSSSDDTEMSVTLLLIDLVSSLRFVFVYKIQIQNTNWLFKSILGV